MTATPDGAAAPGTVASRVPGTTMVRLALDVVTGDGNAPMDISAWSAFTLATALRLAATDAGTWVPCDSCLAPMVWASTANAKRSMPLDPGDHPDGNLIAWWHDDRLWVRGRQAGEQPAEGQHLVISHFATCPAADAHRKR